MSVRTTADDKVNAARDAVKAAVLALNEAVGGVVVGDDWGADDYDEHFKTVLVESYSELIAIHTKIKR